MNEAVKWLSAVSIGLVAGWVLQWLNAPWWVVVPIVLGCLIFGFRQAFRKADATYVDVYYDQPDHDGGSQAQRQGGTPR